MSKLDIAINIAKTTSNKKEALTAIQEALKVSRANASVYLFKAHKALEVSTSTSDSSKTHEVAPEVSEPKSTRVFDENEQYEYAVAMEEREKTGHSAMSIVEYFEMKENLKDLV